MKYGSAAMAEKIAFTFPAAPRNEGSAITEKHYTVQELAALWSLSAKTIRLMFWDEPGVMKLGSDRYKTLRIPESVAQRVHKKVSR